jgi:hypothetical protein
MHTVLQGLAKTWIAWHAAAEERARKRALMLQALWHLRLLQARKAWQSWLSYIQRQNQKYMVRKWLQQMHTAHCYNSYVLQTPRTV